MIEGDAVRVVGGGVCPEWAWAPAGSPARVSALQGDDGAVPDPAG